MEPPQTFPTSKAVTLGDARDGCLSSPKMIIIKLHVTWGCTSAQQLERVIVDSDGRNMHLLNYVDDVSGRCEVCRTFKKAPNVPVVSTSAVSTFNGKLHVDLLLLDAIIFLRAMDAT